VLRVKFFKDAVLLDDEKTTYNMEEMKQMITAFIARDEDELNKIKSERRPGRPASSRQDMLQLKLDHDLQEYKAGYNVPNLLDGETVAHLREWNGSQGGLNSIKFIRVAKDKDKEEENDMTVD
jgi:translation machinery-associated protein 16